MEKETKLIHRLAAAPPAARGIAPAHPPCNADKRTGYTFGPCGIELEKGVHLRRIPPVRPTLGCPLREWPDDE